VTDESGKLLEDEALAQEILDDFFVLAEESQEGDDHSDHDHSGHDHSDHDHPHPH
jgi:hypothetical protein